MNSTIVRLLIAAIGIYAVIKTATAPSRGRFLTLFGNVERTRRPRAFLVCLIAGYVLSAALLLAAAFSDFWLPLLMSE